MPILACWVLQNQKKRREVLPQKLPKRRWAQRLNTSSRGSQKLVVNPVNILHKIKQKNPIIQQTEIQAQRKMYEMHCVYEKPLLLDKKHTWNRSLLNDCLFCTAYWLVVHFRNQQTSEKLFVISCQPHTLLFKSDQCMIPHTNFMNVCGFPKMDN